MRHFALLCLAFLFVGSVTAATPLPVGFRQLEIAHGNKKISVALWYPSKEGAVKDYRYNSGHTGKVIENGTIAEGKWPLLIFSHGFGGSAVGQVAITEGLARQGWIVAAADHSDAVSTLRMSGKTTGDFDSLKKYLREHPFERKDYAYRPAEVRAVLDAMLEKQMALPIDPDKIALAGHSMGGWSVLTVATEDKRIKSVVLYSIGELNWLAGKRYFDEKELKAIKKPVIYFYGSEEKSLNPRGAYADFCFEHTPKPCYQVEIALGNHFTYCDRACAPRAGGTALQLDKIVDTSGAFLERHVLLKSTSMKVTREK